MFTAAAPAPSTVGETASEETNQANLRASYTFGDVSLAGNGEDS